MQQPMQQDRRQSFLEMSSEAALQDRHQSSIEMSSDAAPQDRHQSSLEMSSDAGYTQTLQALTRAVQQQSQAMMTLQSQQAMLEAHEVAFEARQNQMMHSLLSRETAKCKGFDKNG